MTPVTSIKNAFIRRAIMYSVFPLTMLAAIGIVIPITCFLDGLIACVKLQWIALKRILWDVPKHIYKIDVEMAKITLDGLKVGWKGR